MLLGQPGAASAGIQLPSPDLPPEANPSDCAALISRFENVDILALYPNGIDLSHVTLECFENVSTSVDVAWTETQMFDTVLTGTVDNGSGPEAITLTRPATMAAYGKGPNSTGVFMLAMLLISAGALGVSRRQVPDSRQSR